MGSILRSMNPTVKKLLAGAAASKALGLIQANRRRKRSWFGRMAPKLTLAGVAGGLFYLYKTGRLETVIEQAKGLSGPPAQPSGSVDAAGNGSKRSEDEDVTFRSESSPTGAPVS